MEGNSNLIFIFIPVDMDVTNIVVETILNHSFHRISKKCYTTSGWK